MSRANIRRRGAAVASALAVAVVLTGCGLWVPQSTKTNGESSDGVSGQVGSVYVANAVLIADDKQANLVVSLVNESPHDIGLEISHGQPQTASAVSLPVGAFVQLGAKNTQTVIFDDFTVEAGSLYPVYFSYAGQAPLRIGVPVLTSQQPMYRNYSPRKVEQ